MHNQNSIVRFECLLICVMLFYHLMPPGCICLFCLLLNVVVYFIIISVSYSLFLLHLILVFTIENVHAIIDRPKSMFKYDLVVL